MINNSKWRRSIFWLIILSLIISGLFFAFKPQAIVVDFINVQPGLILETVEEEGETRIKDVYVLSAPVTGHMLRIDAEVGDDVIASETLLAQIKPIDPEFLDLRSAEESRARVKVAEASLKMSEAELIEAESELEYATSQLQRAEKLIQKQAIALRKLENAKKEFKAKKASVNAANALVRTRQFELSQAKAHLLSPANIQTSEDNCQCVTILAPITGKILQVINESEGVISMGTPLMEIGNPSNLEVIVDFLSTDAVKIEPGQRVVIDEWGGKNKLQGIVRKIEPFGFTKTSALGIDEQRVNVIIDLIDTKDKWKRLGHGYQIEASVVLSEKDDVLKVPLTALFRDNEKWAVFMEQEHRAKLQYVKLGHRNELEAEVIQGLSTGDRVILHPSDQIINGVRIKERL